MMLPSRLGCPLSLKTPNMDAGIVGGVPSQRDRAVRVHRCRQIPRSGRGLNGRGQHCCRCPAGQFFFVTGVIGEGDPHLDGLALVTVYQGVGAACSPADVRVVRQPLVGEGGVCQAVGVVDSRSVSC